MTLFQKFGFLPFLFTKRQMRLSLKLDLSTLCIEYMVLKEFSMLLLQYKDSNTGTYSLFVLE